MRVVANRTHVIQKMKKTLLALAIALAAGSTACPAATPTVDPLREGVTFDPFVPELDEEGLVVRLRGGYTRSDGRHFGLVAEMPWPTEPYDDYAPDTSQDINFDGIPDLMVLLLSVNAWSNFVYAGYVWDVERHEFVEVEEFSVISNPYCDSEHRRVLGSLRVGDEVELSTYVWRDGKLVEIEREQTTIDYDDE